MQVTRAKQDVVLPRTQRAVPEARIALVLALLLFGVYLFSFNGRITSSDGLSMFAVTESFVKRGDLATDQMWTFFGTKSTAAPDGEVYSKYGYGTSLLAAPLYALALYVPFSGLMQVTLLTSAVAVALTAAVLYLTTRRMGFEMSVAVIVALLFGLATPAWVYAKEFWSEPFAAMALFAAFYFCVRYRETRSARHALWAGVLLGLAITVRTTNVLLVPVFAGFVFVEWGGGDANLTQSRKERRVYFGGTGRDLLAFLIPIGVLGLSVLVYNYMRFGNFLTTGYRADEDFSNNILLGAYGLLVSPGKGLFVYAPFLAAVPYGVWRFFVKQRQVLIFIGAVVGFHVLVFSAWYYWWGGTNWGARFLVPALPYLVLLCAPLVKLVLDPHKGAAITALRMIFGVLVVISVVNELAGVAVNSLTYQMRTGAFSANPNWDAIFVPALSPLIGHWQTLKATNLDVAWMRATPTEVQVDWVVVALTGAFVLGCAWLLVRLVRGKDVRRPILAGAVICAVGLAVFLLVRYADDPRLVGNAGYMALLATLEEKAARDDLLVLNDDGQARVFFNSNRAPLKWYGLSRDPARWDATIQGVIARETASHPRVWLAYDEGLDAAPGYGAVNPMREWFEKNLEELERYEFEGGVWLVGYQ